MEIDGKSVVGKTTKEMSAILKGGAGTILKVKYERDGVASETTITREVIKIPSVPYYGMIDEEIGYVKLNSFTSTASSDVVNALKYLKDSSGMKKLGIRPEREWGRTLARVCQHCKFLYCQRKDGSCY